MSNAALIQTDRFVLSETERSAIEHEMHHYEDPRAASIEALKLVQKGRGWVPDGAIYAIAEILGIPASDVEGVATFYSQIFRQPVGRHVIRVCDSMVCYIGGHESVVGAIQQQLGIGLGQTTADGRFTLLPVCCLGNCDKAPALMIDDDTHGNVQVDGVATLLEAYV
ncbi:NADH-quinone oxidoreductase subunit NuoE [Pseudomonas mangiferae]|uniref:NADH-quinone oxidoreductase subunit E n=1 Tax=Pseudomonas mangiferae TaxID=2593654 RepID=A0A553H431_9PSED|nr:NADH-quinone oxidoreductase subunit NuoE [Pseudomonas mangiferae]TRX76488.1 NADH-quinone oxidoreductase subunit NuoE [Pseudomonas mangiferae]